MAADAMQAWDEAAAEAGVSRMAEAAALPVAREGERSRLLFNEDGETLDEIVFDGFMHLEQMGDDEYYLGVGESQFLLTACKSKLIVTRYTDGHDFPRIERHKTAAEVQDTGFDPAYITLKGEDTAHKRADDAENAAIPTPADEGLRKDNEALHDRLLDTSHDVARYWNEAKELRAALDRADSIFRELDDYRKRHLRGDNREYFRLAIGQARQDLRAALQGSEGATNDAAEPNGSGRS